MRKLIPLEHNERDFQKQIYYINENPLRVKEGKELIHENYSHIRDRFEEYIQNKKSLENINCSSFEKSTVPNEEGAYEKLYSLYDSQESLKDEVRAISETRCPYCGITESPFHVDHYVPRGKFPEFSVLRINLIAACASCNSRFKGKKFVEGDQRLYFNPYFDDFIENIQFLKCTISVDGIYPAINFTIDENLEESNNYAYKIIKNHFDNLKLATRYKELARVEIFNKFKDEYIDPDTLEFDDVTIEELKRDIEKKLRAFRAYNINHWEKVFLETLLNADDCLNLIVNKLIPIN